MSRWMLIGALVLATHVSWSRNLDRGPVRVPQRSLDIPYPQDENVVLRNGTIALNFTNYGYFGNDAQTQSSSLDDPCTGHWAPQFEYPVGSGAQYLFQGALWIGAQIEDTSGGSTPRVSLGTDGWQNPDINEFHAGESPGHGIVLKSNLPGATDCFGGNIYDPSARANVEAVAVYSDTLTDRLFVRNDPTDGPHVPLGLEVTQTALLWTSPEYARFVILEFGLRNIGQNSLLDPSIGMYVDGDVGISGLQDEHTDDITGSLLYPENQARTIAWIADNDGRTSQVNEFRLPHAMGFAGLSTDDDSVAVHRPGNFNWWMPNPDHNMDFGPAWTDSPNWTTILGYPEGDASRYDVLKGGERDYGQYALATDHGIQNDSFPCHDGSDHTWRNVDLSPNIITDVANGYDTRFLLSWGQIGIFDHVDESGVCHYRLNPGENTSFTAVLFIGENFHDVAHQQPNGNQLDSTLFHYDGLIETYNQAKYLFDQGYAFQPPTPVVNLHAQFAQDGALPLAWEAPQVGGVAGYRVFGRPDSGRGERVELTANLITTLQFNASGLTNGDYWLIEVQTEDAQGNHSAYAEEMVRVGAIPMDVELTGEADHGINTLSWTAVNDPTFTYYQVVRADLGNEVTFDSLTGLSLDDGDVASGRTYTYTLYLRNSLGILSLPGSSITLTPFAPEQTILVYDETKTPSGNDLGRGAVQDSSVRQWYELLLTNMNEPFEYIDLGNDDVPLSLETLAGHSVVIWHSENPKLVTSQFANQREGALRQYVAIGGKLIRFGRYSLQSVGLPIGLTASPNMLTTLEPLTFDAVFVTTTSMSSDPAFRPKAIGATSVTGEFLSFSFDATKVAALNFAGHTGYTYLPGIDLVWPNGNTRPLYTVVLGDEDSTNFENAPCSAIGAGVISNYFPLYFVPEQQAQQILAASLNALRTQNLDTPDPVEPLPTAYALRQNYPNPFNPSTTIEFDLPMTRDGSLRVYNIQGQLVSTLMSGTLEAGTHRVEFNAEALATGLYFYRLELGGEAITKKMLLLK